jgi:outer membrane protein assembly factor BamE (lipoprotein component of BamABCDE complex)
MSNAEPVEAADGAKDNAARFVKDQDGRTVFFPNGPARTGYVVPDAASEQALRDAARRSAKLRKWGVPAARILMLPFVAGAYALAGSHLFLGLGLLAVGIIFAVLPEAIVYRLWMGRLVKGLEPVDKQVGAGKRVPYRAIATIAGASGVIWLILELYDRRIAAISGNGNVTYFYRDISWPIFIAIIGGLMVAGLVASWGKLAARFSEVRLWFGLWFSGLMALGGLWWSVSTFFNPTPEVAMTPASLYCGWQVPWWNITGMRIEYGGYKRYALVQLKPGAFPSGSSTGAIAQDGSARCEITKLNVGYSEVYDAMRAAWQAHREDDGRGASLDDELPKILAGATREQVLIVLGQPSVTNYASPNVYYYLRSRPKDAAGEGNAPSERILAVYFDDAHRVQRFAEYGLQNGRLFDYVKHEFAPSEDQVDPLGILTFLRH